MKKIFVGASEGFVKNFEAYLREVFASTGLRPEECKLVQRQTTSGNIVEIVAWVEPLGNAEMDAYRQRAEVAEAELARLREASRETATKQTPADVRSAAENILNSVLAGMRGEF